MATSRSDASRRPPSLRKDVVTRPLDEPGRAAVPPRPRRQPGRDRRPDHPRLSRAGRWRSSPSTATPTPKRRTCGSPTRPSASAHRRRPRATCGSTRSSPPLVATGAEAVHPGYGFLAERAAFARAVEDAGLVYVGPSPDDDRGARRQAQREAARGARRRAGGPRHPRACARSIGRTRSRASSRRRSAIGFPLLVKAAAGGGGRGMRRVARAEDLPAALAAGSHEASSAFGDGAVYLEREIAARAPRRGPADRRRTTATSSRWASATARCSAGTRSSSRSRPRRA